MRLTDAKRELARPRRRGRRLRHRRAARGHAAVHPRGGWRRALQPKSTYPLAEGLPELRAAIAAWIARRFGPALDPGTEVLPTLGSKEAIFHLAQVVGGDSSWSTTPGYPVAERGAAFAGKQVLELPLLAERGFLPDLDAVDWSATVGDPVAQLPEQPDRRHRAAGALRARRGDRARARRRGRLRRGLLGDLLRLGAAGLGAPGRRPPQRDRAQHALQALLDARLPQRLRGRRPRGDRGAQALPAQRRRRAAGVHPDRRGRRVGATRRTWRTCGRSTAPSARCCCRCSRPRASTTPAATRRSSSGSTPASAPTRWPPRCSSAASCVAPGSFFGPAGEGFLRLALVPTLAECERAAALLASVVGVQGGVEAGPGA